MDFFNHKFFYHSFTKYVFTLSLFLGIIIFFYSIFTFKSSLLTFQSLQCPHQNQTILRVPKDELGETLERASMGNKTLIIAVVNNAYVEGEVVPNMLDLFLEGLWVGEGTRELVKHLMIVAVDQSAYDRCIFGGLHCYRLVTDDGLDFMGEQLAKTHGFISLMWRRTLFLLEVLERGYNFIFTDVDMIWLRNPFTILTTNTTQDLDIQFSLDSKNTTFTINRVNTGFYYVKSNNKTISLFKKWYDMKDMSRNRVKDQDILQLLTWQGVFTDLDINVRFLETELFSGFCHNNFDFRFVFTVHANCRLDIRVKVADLVQVLRDWNSFNVTRSNS